MKTLTNIQFYNFLKSQNILPKTEFVATYNTENYQDVTYNLKQWLDCDHAGSAYDSSELIEYMKDHTGLEWQLDYTTYSIQGNNANFRLKFDIYKNNDNTDIVVLFTPIIVTNLIIEATNSMIMIYNSEYGFLEHLGYPVSFAWFSFEVAGKEYELTLDNSLDSEGLDFYIKAEDDSLDQDGFTWLDLYDSETALRSVSEYLSNNFNEFYDLKRLVY